MRIIIRPHGADKFQAKLDGGSAWGCGETPTLAIGDLVQSHPEAFGLIISVTPDTQEQLDRMGNTALDKRTKEDKK
mgnify:CR=1 FL=1